MPRLRIAVVGTGIAGNVAARELSHEHDITVFEANSHIGGHVNTVSVEDKGEVQHIDTGFIVYNERTYPKFIALLRKLDVESQESSMSFSVQNPACSLEYNGSTLNSLFAQRQNIFRPSFHRMIGDILRFNREARMLLDSGDHSTTLAEFIRSRRYSDEFSRNYLIPMGAAIWSANPAVMVQMPAAFFARFFHNHGLLDLRNRPTWRVIKGGSQAYVTRLVANHRHRIHLNALVQAVTRYSDRVMLKLHGAEPVSFDHVILACHADQALQLISNPLPPERQVLGAFRYQRNESVLHTDSAVMPANRRAWAAWNYRVPTDSNEHVSVTYHMNRLQGLACATQYFVTLNDADKIDTEKIIYKADYEHPVFTAASVSAQSRQHEINGLCRTWYCGAYWRNGFHEDGVASAQNMLRDFSEAIRYEKRDFQRAG